MSLAFKSHFCWLSLFNKYNQLSTFHSFLFPWIHVPWSLLFVLRDFILKPKAAGENGCGIPPAHGYISILVKGGGWGTPLMVTTNERVSSKQKKGFDYGDMMLDIPSNSSGKRLRVESLCVDTPTSSDTSYFVTTPRLKRCVSLPNLEVHVRHLLAKCMKADNNSTIDTDHNFEVKIFFQCKV